MVAHAKVRSGEALALRGPMIEERKVQKGGLFRRASTNSVHKRLYAIVVPLAAGAGEVSTGAWATTVHPVIVRIPSREGRVWVGARDIPESELPGVLRSLELTHPGKMVVLIRADAGVPTERVVGIQDRAIPSGIRTTLLSRPLPVTSN